MKKVLASLTALSVLAVISWNYFVNSHGLNGNTVSSLSEEYDTLFTPAGYAFSIWGFIFIGLVVLSVYLMKLAFQDRDEYDQIERIGPWLIIANVLNGSWSYFWLMEFTGLSVVSMLGMLISLHIVIVRLDMERWNAPRSIIVYTWWPMCLYAGWISVATVANISAYLVKIGWSPVLSETGWAFIMVMVSAMIMFYMIYSRNMREYAAVGVWALVAIAVRHWLDFPPLAWSSLGAAILLLIYILIHGYQSRKENPLWNSSLE